MNDASDLRRTLKTCWSPRGLASWPLRQGQPYGSLVAFAETDDLRQLSLPPIVIRASSPT